MTWSDILSRRRFHALTRSFWGVLACVAGGGAKAADGPWVAMDYGPFLTASIEMPAPRTNVAFKGIAVNLGKRVGSAANEAIVFDTDLLTYSAGWTGDFVALKGVVFDGEHWAYPRAVGTPLFGNPSAPGWAGPGKSGFDDPRSHPYGPLPRDWAHWRGLHVADGTVVFSYTVGGMEVLESPDVLPAAGRRVIRRTLNLGPTSTEQAMQVAHEVGWRSERRSLREPSVVVGDDSEAGESLAVLSEEGDDSAVVVARVAGDTAGLRWQIGGGNLRLWIPSRAASRKFQVLLWRGARREVADVARGMALGSPTADLVPLTRGGATQWRERVITQGRAGSGDGPYVIDELTGPEPNPWKSWMRFSGMDFFPGGQRAALSTWNGDVWVVSGVDGNLERLEWQRIATGLFQPLGLKILDGEIYVLGRDQITRLRDLNGDGETDFYENFNNDALVSEHFHEFANDLKLGPDGDFYYVKCARHALPAVHAQHGSLIRVSRDGTRSEIVARGFRAVNGLGVGPGGEFTTIDNQGHWMPANRLNWVRPGGWYGNQWAWNPDERTSYDEPLCWMHNSVDRSGGTQLWVPGSAWGPLEGELITISYGMGQMFLVLKEQVGSVMQGAVTRFPLEFETGVMRGVFHPGNGQLYTCGLFGWAGNKTRAGGFYRVRYTGRPVHLARRWNVVRDGMVLGFTEPLEEERATDPGNYDVKAWNYRWSATYGSPDFKRDGTEGRDTWRVESATLSADRRSVFLKIPEVRQVMQCQVTFRLRGNDGTILDNFIHGTIHQVGDRSGSDVLGPGALAQRDGLARDAQPMQPGLVQRLRRAGDSDWKDARVARMAAWHVPAGGVASPFLEPGPVRSEWEGFLALDLNEQVTFHVEGRGRARLWIDDRSVLEREGDPISSQPSHPVSLRRGRNRVRLEYEGPAAGDAVIRLLWTSRDRGTGPIPPTQWVHLEGDPLLARQALIREGRRLMADRHCVACHTPEAGLGSEAMPELALQAPSLAGIGGRQRGQWLAQWLVDPPSFGIPGRMPRMFHGDAGVEEARDVAAFLATLIEGAPQGGAPAGPAEAREGARFFEELGCVGCHQMPYRDDRASPGLTSLAQVGLKWKPAALEAYLRNPGRHYPGTRMPNYQLTESEAAALAAFMVLPEMRALRDAPVLGRADRGAKWVAERGCLQCHGTEGLTVAGPSTYPMPPLLGGLRRSEWSNGCLAESVPDRGRAPDFRWTPAERRALRSLRGTDMSVLLARDPVAEYAERQMETLACAACHPRDGRSDVLTAWEASQTKGRGDDDEEGGSVHVGRPPLTYAGEKLYGDWMARFLSGSLSYKPRSSLQGRMPAFPAYARGLAAGMAAQHGYPMESARRIELDPGQIELGHQLTKVEGGFACVTCHGVGARPALAGKDTASVNFVHVSERLRPSYYARYLMDPPSLVPGTMMPKFVGDDGRTSIRTVHDGDPVPQFDAIWHYLHSLGVSGPDPGPDPGAGTKP